MLKITHVIMVSAVALSACSSGANGVNGVAPATGESGYASAGIDLDTVGESLAAKARLQGGDFSGAPNVGVSTLNLAFEDTGVADEFIVTFDGVPVNLAWNAITNRFEGLDGDVEIRVSPWGLSDNNQSALVWINILDSRGGGDFQHWGPMAVGFNTGPDVVAGRADMASFSGTGIISINAVDNSFWTSADGPASLDVDFAAGTLSGTIDLTDCGCGFGGAAIDPTTITLSGGTISGNTFTMDADIDLADLNLATMSTLTVNGDIYETNATALGGAFDGFGTSTIGGEETTLIGAFGADED